MKRSIKILIALGAVALLVGAYFLVTYLIANKEVDTPSFSSDMIKLSEVKEKDIVRIDYIRSGSTMTLIKEDDTWVIDYPYPIETQRYSVSDIASGVTSVYADRLIDENPSDLSVYGLDTPIAKGVATDKDGVKTVFKLGAKTATGDTYYFQRQGDEKVYTVLKYTAERYLTEINDLRIPNIKGIDPTNLAYLRYVTLEGKVVELIPRPEDEEQISNLFTTLVMVKPYKARRGIDTEDLNAFIQAFVQTLEKKDFIDDDPKDLSAYGLDPPRAEILARDSENMIHIYFGDEVEENVRYARLADSPQVFTMSVFSNVQIAENMYEDVAFLEVSQFDLVDKFIMIPNIDTVDAFTVETADGETYRATIKRVNKPGSDETEDMFEINGKEIEDKPFRQYYQKVIGLFSDADNPDPKPMTKADITITYELNNKFKTGTVLLEKIDRNFYAAYVDGYTELLVSDYQVDAIFTDLETLLAE